MTQMNHTYAQKLSTSRTRSLLLLASTLLFALSANVLGQAPAVKQKAVHLKLASEETPLAEDVYFNAEQREVQAPSSLAANQLSATSIGSVMSILFNSARVSIQAESDPMVATWTGTVTVPINAGAKPKRRSYLQDIRGSVNKTADTRVTIFLELGGKSFVAEFPFGMRFSGHINRRFISVIKPASPMRYTASITIFAERRDPKSAILVDIDALDVDAR